MLDKTLMEIKTKVLWSANGDFRYKGYEEVAKDLSLALSTSWLFKRSWARNFHSSSVFTCISLSLLFHFFRWTIYSVEIQVLLQFKWSCLSLQFCLVCISQNKVRHFIGKFHYVFGAISGFFWDKMMGELFLRLSFGRIIPVLLWYWCQHSTRHFGQPCILDMLFTLTGPPNRELFSDEVKYGITFESKNFCDYPCRCCVCRGSLF